MKCEALLSKDFIRLIKYENRTNCKRDAIYKLDNKCLCANHAGLMLLRKAIVDKKIEEL